VLSTFARKSNVNAVPIPLVVVMVIDGIWIAVAFKQSIAITR
jgi:hypothetical protein